VALLGEDAISRFADLPEAPRSVVPVNLGKWTDRSAPVLPLERRLRERSGLAILDARSTSAERANHIANHIADPVGNQLGSE
jgi:hypothetical protein